jgi:hypothetical protein
MWNLRGMARIVATCGPRVHPVLMIREHCIDDRPRVFGIQRRDAQAAAAIGHSALSADQFTIL